MSFTAITFVPRQLWKKKGNERGREKVSRVAGERVKWPKDRCPSRAGEIRISLQKV